MWVILTDGAVVLSPANVPHIVKSVVALCSSTIVKMAAACARKHGAPISASPATIFTAAGDAPKEVTIFNSGVPHHLWPSY